jgi:hypothetical protein
METSTTLDKPQNKNWKYWTSEVASVGISLTASALAAHFSDKITDSNAVISGVSALAGTAGWIAGTTGIYTALHTPEYFSKKRSFKKDVSSICKSNLEGIATNYVVRIPLQFALQKYLDIDPAIAASISHITGGIGGTVVRLFRNYQRNIFGNKKYDPLKIY